MTDLIDDAQRREEYDRDRSIEAQLQRIRDSFAPRRDGLDGVCIDCGGSIELERLKVLAGKTSRCASCAQDHELRMRRGR